MNTQSTLEPSPNLVMKASWRASNYFVIKDDNGTIQYRISKRLLPPVRYSLMDADGRTVALARPQIVNGIRVLDAAKHAIGKITSQGGIHFRLPHMMLRLDWSRSAHPYHWRYERHPKGYLEYDVVFLDSVIATVRQPLCAGLIMTRRFECNIGNNEHREAVILLCLAADVYMPRGAGVA